MVFGCQSHRFKPQLGHLLSTCGNDFSSHRLAFLLSKKGVMKDPSRTELAYFGDPKNHLESLLKYRLLGPTPEIMIWEGRVGPENLHL